jgi:hypothetical protein
MWLYAPEPNFETIYTPPASASYFTPQNNQRVPKCMPLLWHAVLILSLSAVYTQYVGSSLFYYTVTLFNAKLYGIVIMQISQTA